MFSFSLENDVITVTEKLELIECVLPNLTD